MYRGSHPSVAAPAVGGVKSDDDDYADGDDDGRRAFKDCFDDHFDGQWSDDSHDGSGYDDDGGCGGDVDSGGGEEPPQLQLG